MSSDLAGPMELQQFNIADSEKRLIDENKKIENVKTNVKIDNWEMAQSKMQISFTYTARYLGKESVLHIPEIANYTIRGKLELSVSEREAAEINGYSRSQEGIHRSLIILDKSNPNYVNLTLPRNYIIEISKIADEKCKTAAIEFMNSLPGAQLK